MEGLVGNGISREEQGPQHVYLHYIFDDRGPAGQLVGGLHALPSLQPAGGPRTLQMGPGGDGMGLGREGAHHRWEGAAGAQKDGGVEQKDKKTETETQKKREERIREI